jgi:hypothetical protein
VKCFNEYNGLVYFNRGYASDGCNDPTDIDDLRDDALYSKISLHKICTKSGRSLSEAIANHPKAPPVENNGRSKNGHYYYGETIKRFYEVITSQGEGVSVPPWISASDKQAEHADIVARIMAELEPHISNAVRKALFEENK